MKSALSQRCSSSGISSEGRSPRYKSDATAEGSQDGIGSAAVAIGTRRRREKSDSELRELAVALRRSIATRHLVHARPGERIPCRRPAGA